MKNNFSRTQRIIGEENLRKLSKSNILIFGIGGVGGHCAESLVRSGVGKITIVDMDTVDITNINRQIVATEKTVGKIKVDVMKKRLLEINSDLEIISLSQKYIVGESWKYDFQNYDYIVDAIDDVQAKIDIIKAAKAEGISIISSMGTGNKMDASMFEVVDIYKTEVCPLAKVVRKELRKLGIKDVKVVYSKEEPAVRVSPPGSMSFVPPVAGMIMAGGVIKDLLKF